MVNTPQHTSPCYIDSPNRNVDTSRWAERRFILPEMEYVVAILTLLVALLIMSHRD